MYWSVVGDFSGVPSDPAALFLLSCLMAGHISFLVRALQSICNSLSVGGMSGWFWRDGLSTHLFLCAFTSCIYFPSSSFTGHSGLTYFPDSFLIVVYSSRMLPWVATFSASSATPASCSCLPLNSSWRFCVCRDPLYDDTWPRTSWRVEITVSFISFHEGSRLFSSCRAWQRF